jgi:hypothetical protein
VIVPRVLIVLVSFLVGQVSHCLARTTKSEIAQKLELEIAVASISMRKLVALIARLA